MMSRWLWIVCLIWGGTAQAFDLLTEQVDSNIYALVGEIGPRTAENHALNNTQGFIVTDAGVVLVSSGASPAGARLIQQSIARITDQPVRWVFNVGAQDHHWLGNSFFAAQGAKIIALEKTVESQKRHVDDHLFRLNQINKADAAEVKPFYAPKPLTTDKAAFELGAEQFELIWPGGGHFPGDAVLWMPQRKILFSGDYVFLDRMLGVQPYSPVLQWRQSFHKLSALQPKTVIPGHGHAAPWAKAERETGDYLDYLVTHVSKAVEDWKEIEDTVNDLSDAPAFKHLKFYDSWHRKNINQVYLELESAQ